MRIQLLCLLFLPDGLPFGAVINSWKGNNPQWDRSPESSHFPRKEPIAADTSAQEPQQTKINENPLNVKSSFPASSIWGQRGFHLLWCRPSPCLSACSFKPMKTMDEKCDKHWKEAGVGVTTVEISPVFPLKLKRVFEPHEDYATCYSTVSAQCRWNGKCM